MKHKSIRHTSLKRGFLFMVAIQILLMFTLKYSLNFPSLYLVVFIGINALYNSVVYTGLVKADHLFFYTLSKEELKGINLSNWLTIIRLSNLVTIMFLVILNSQYSINFITISFVIFIFLTDWFDGFIARQTDTITEIGKFLDSTSDYILLLFITILMFYFQMISLIMFLIILGRGFSQFPRVLYYKRKNKPIPFKTSQLGKASVFIIMCYFVFRLILTAYGNGIPKSVNMAIDITTGLVILASTIEKLWEFWKNRIT